MSHSKPKKDNQNSLTPEKRQMLIERSFNFKNQNNNDEVNATNSPNLHQIKFNEYNEYKKLISVDRKDSYHYLEYNKTPKEDEINKLKLNLDKNNSNIYQVEWKNPHLNFTNTGEVNLNDNRVNEGITKHFRNSSHDFYKLNNMNALRFSNLSKLNISNEHVNMNTINKFNNDNENDINEPLIEKDFIQIKENNEESNIKGIGLIIFLLSLCFSSMNLGIYRKFVKNYDSTLDNFIEENSDHRYSRHRKDLEGESELKVDWTISENFIYKEILVFTWRNQMVMIFLIIYLLFIKIIEAICKYRLGNSYVRDSTFFKLHIFTDIFCFFSVNNYIYSFFNAIISFMLLLSTAFVPVSITVLITNSTGFFCFLKENSGYDTENGDITSVNKNLADFYETLDKNKHDRENNIMFNGGEKELSSTRSIKKNENSEYRNSNTTRTIGQIYTNFKQEKEDENVYINGTPTSNNIIQTNKFISNNSLNLIKFFCCILYIMGITLLLSFKVKFLFYLGIAMPFISILLNINYQRGYMETFIRELKPFQIVFNMIIISNIVLFFMIIYMQIFYLKKNDYFSLLSIVGWTDLNKLEITEAVVVGIVSGFSIVFSIISSAYLEKNSIKLYKLMEIPVTEIICVYLLEIYKPVQSSEYYFGIFNIWLVIAIVEFYEGFSWLRRKSK